MTSRTRSSSSAATSTHWDVGTGAIDDGGGCVVTWEAVRLLKTLGLRPRRTVRVVLFTNEENGLRGGLAYRDQHRAELANHVLMLESDGGVFRPRGFGFSGNDRARTIVQAVASLLTGIQAEESRRRAEARTSGRACKPHRCRRWRSTSMDRRYFTYHHSGG